MYTTLSVTSVSIRRQNISNRVIRSISHSNHKGEFHAFLLAFGKQHPVGNTTGARVVLHQSQQPQGRIPCLPSCLWEAASCWEYHRSESGPPCPGRRCWPQLRQQP